MLYKPDPDGVAHAANMLVCIGGLATATGIIAGGGAAIGGFLSWREIQKRLPERSKALAASLSKELEAGLAEQHIDQTTRLLIPQMIEASLPSPHRVMEARCDGATLADMMAARLSDPAHKAPLLIDNFKRIVGALLDKLLADKAFSDELAPAFYKKVLDDNAAIQKGIDSLAQQFGSIAEALGSVGALAKASRDQLEALASRFEIDRAFEIGDAELRALLEAKAEEYRSFKTQIDSIDERIAGLGNLKAAAKAAAEKPDLEEVENLLRMVHETELDIAWQTASLRADNALLRGRVHDAYHILSAAADAFAAVDLIEPARRRIEAEDRLYQHGMRYGSSGMQKSVQMLQAALRIYTEADHPVQWAMTQNNLGIALGNQGSRMGGDAGAKLLGEAVEAYRAALRIYTEVDHPVQWATTQNNLGNALGDQGNRMGGDAGARLLGEAVEAYSAALRIYTEVDHPVQWATTQNNLGSALANQGSRMGGDAGARLLGEAVEAYSAALRIRTEVDHPVQWATTQNNLGNALGDQGSRMGGDAGARLLGEAVEAHSAALRIRTEVDHPVDWAMTQNNLGTALANQGSRMGGDAGAKLLAEAVDAYRAALRIYTEVDHPVQWATTQNNLGSALANQGRRMGGDAGARLLGEAVDAYRAALRIRTEVDHPVQWAMTQNNLGNALGDQGSRMGGDAGARLLGEAVDAYSAALRIYTEVDHPVQWATTQNNLGNALGDQGNRMGGDAGARLLGEAVEAYSAALRIYTEADHPVQWAMTHENIALTEEEIAEHETCKEPRPNLEAALAHLDLALRVFSPEHMPYDFGKATESRARIQAKLTEI